MKGSRFTEEQIIGVLRKQEAEATVAEVRRKHRMSSATFAGIASAIEAPLARRLPSPATRAA